MKRILARILKSTVKSNGNRIYSGFTEINEFMKMNLQENPFQVASAHDLRQFYEGANIVIMYNKVLRLKTFANTMQILRRGEKSKIVN